MLRSLAVFAIVSTLHFFLSVLGLAFVLPAAFETQGGAGFWAAPGKSMLVWMSNVLFGLAAAGLLHRWRKRRT